MPSRKIITTLIICCGAVLSIWLLQRTPVNTLSQKYDGTVSTYTYETTSNSTSTDWKKILVYLDQKSTQVEDLTDKNDETYDDTTLTAQMSRDFMSQYLLLKKGGKTVTQEDLDKIISNVTNAPQYNQAVGAVYLPTNLKVIRNNDAVTLKKYKDEITNIINKRTAEIKDDPRLILVNILQTNSTDSVKKLNNIIATNKAFISDFLNIDVPYMAVGTHLNLINASSGMLVTLESMKELDSDPIKAMLGLSRYNSTIQILQKRMNEMNTYLAKIN